MTKEEAIKRAKKSLDLWYQCSNEERATEQIQDILETLYEAGYSEMLDRYIAKGTVLQLRK